MYILQRDEEEHSNGYYKMLQEHNNGYYKMLQERNNGYYNSCH